MFGCAGELEGIVGINQIKNKGVVVILGGVKSVNLTREEGEIQMSTYEGVQPMESKVEITLDIIPQMSPSYKSVLKLIIADDVLAGRRDLPCKDESGRSRVTCPCPAYSNIPFRGCANDLS